MASTCTVNKGTRQIGTGSVADGSANLTSFTLTDDVWLHKVDQYLRRKYRGLE